MQLNGIQDVSLSKVDKLIHIYRRKERMNLRKNNRIIEKLGPLGEYIPTDQRNQLGDRWKYRCKEKHDPCEGMSERLYIQNKTRGRIPFDYLVFLVFVSLLLSLERAEVICKDYKNSVWKILHVLILSSIQQSLFSFFRLY